MPFHAKLLTLSAQSPDTVPIRRGAEVLRAGGLVAFPTETVYGLGADATNDKAVAAIFAAKGRPSFNPLIAHLSDVAELDALVIMDDRARALAQSFMPGALTLVLPRRPDTPVSWLVSAGLDSLAVRVPAHPVARTLIRETGRPIAAPSANPSGSISPTTPLHVMEGLADKVDLVLGAGRCAIGVESTILDLTGPKAKILRPGGVTHAQIESVIGAVEAPHHHTSTTPNAPGQLESHYAPHAQVRLHATSVEPDEALLAFGADCAIKGGAARLNLSEAGDLNEAAANLFAMLRQLDKESIKTIAVMPIPESGLGAAINDRLRRAAAPRS